MKTNELRLAELWGGVLATRSSGLAIRAQMEERLQETGILLLIVDFGGINVIANSCADESFGKFFAGLRAGLYGQHSVVLTGMEVDVEETLHAVLDRRGLIALASASDGSLHLVGKSTGHLTTLVRLLGTSPRRAAALAQELGTSPQVANNGLKQLWETGAVQRTSMLLANGGREYLYELPQVPVPA